MLAQITFGLLSQVYPVNRNDLARAGDAELDALFIGFYS
jgi:hypothetical protein